MDTNCDEKRSILNYKFNEPDPKKDFASKCLYEFMNAIDNYHMFKSSLLISYATEVCLLYAKSDFSGCIAAHKKFNKLIFKYELEGTFDLVNPINNIEIKAKELNKISSLS